MSKTLLDRAEEHVVDPLHKMSRATSAISEAVEDGIHAVKRVGKAGSDAAEEFVDDAKERIKRHPAGTVVAAFAAGILLGGFMDCMMRRK